MINSKKEKINNLYKEILNNIIKNKVSLINKDNVRFVYKTFLTKYGEVFIYHYKKCGTIIIMKDFKNIISSNNKDRMYIDDVAMKDIYIQLFKKFNMR